MAGNGRPYDVLVQKLKLPAEILKLVEPPFKDLNCPLIEESTEDIGFKKLNYFSSTCKGKKVVLLHLDGETTADPAAFHDVVSIAYVFVSQSIAIFFFAPVKDLSRNYSRTAAKQLLKSFPTLEALEFFDQSDLDLFNAREESERPALVRLVLGLDDLYKSSNGPGSNGSGSNGPKPPRPKPDLSKIQVRVAEILYEGFRVQSDPPGVYFNSIIFNLEWPPGWTWEPPGEGRASASGLVKYLIGRDDYPPSSSMNGYRPLGALLSYLIKSVGPKTAKEIYQMIADNQLIDSEDVLAQLKEYCKDDD